MTLREHAVTVLRMTVTALITTVIIIAGLQVVYGAQTREQQDVAETLVHSNLANACILALPVDPVNGRDPDSVQLCFTQYGLEPPILHNP